MNMQQKTRENVAAVIISVVGVAAGIFLSAFSVTHWVKDYYWKYKFKQTRPSSVEFICSPDFIYKSEMKIEINGDEAYWETTYEEEQWEIEYERNNILEVPGNYL